MGEYNVKVTDDQMYCIIVVLKLLMQLAIAYFTKRQVTDTVLALESAMKLVTRKNN